MFNSSSLVEKIQKVRNSIVAIGFQLSPTQVTIIGSGFSVNDKGQILSAAHLYNSLNETQISNLKCMAIIEQGVVSQYKWLPLSLIKKEDSSDAALLQISNYHDTLLKPLPLGDPETVQEGQGVYFIGFPYAALLMNEGFGITLIINRGIISAVKRKGDSGNPLDWFIVDAISNPGNSGCPLFDEDTNKVIGIMSIAFRTQSQSQKYSDLDIREPMHIAGAKPISWAKGLLV